MPASMPQTLSPTLVQRQKLTTRAELGARIQPTSADAPTLPPRRHRRQLIFRNDRRDRRANPCEASADAI
jgi:hypothetical protein